MTDYRKTVLERRAALQQEAADMGIDAAYISHLVESFYALVHDNPRLGPIFECAISDWDAHLAQMKRFWASVALSSGEYSGQPVPKHTALSGVSKEDFQIWLALFESVLHETAPTPPVVPYFMERARRIANSLQLAMFGYDGVKM